jgi:rod shape-determining protein MreC
VREPAHGLRLVCVMFIAGALMFADHRYPQFSHVRNQMSVLVYPIKSLVNLPIAFSRVIGGYFASHQSLYVANKRLQEENLLQQGRLQKLAALETENAQLRQLLQSGSQVAENLVIANIINVDPDPFTHQVIINKGKHDHVYAGQPIIDSEGIMGTIVTVNDLESRAILITDASHAVPVEDVRNGLRAIAVGTGSGVLELRHVPNSTDIAVGDMMITSGLGGRFPVGFPVGQVKEVKHEPGKPFATIVLAPSAKLDRSRHILLLENSKQHAKE